MGCDKNFKICVIGEREYSCVVMNIFDFFEFFDYIYLLVIVRIK